MLGQETTKLKRRGNAWTDPAIKVTTLRSATKSHQFDTGVLLGRFIAHVCGNLIHVFIEEGLRSESRDANHPVSDRIGHALRLLECISSVHREMLAHERNQFGGGMQSLERRHLPNKVLGLCSFSVNQGICGGEVHDRYGN